MSDGERLVAGVALVEGGPLDGQSFEGVFIGRFLRFPGDEKHAGRYELDTSRGVERSLIYVWRES